MRRLGKFLLAFLMIFGLLATEAKASSMEDILAQLETTTQNMSQLVKEDAMNYMAYFAEMNDDSLEFMIDNQVGFMKRAAEVMQDYRKNDTLGAYKQITDAKVEEKGDSHYIVTVTAECEKVNLIMTMEYKSIVGQLAPVDISYSVEEKTETSMAEKMKNAALNTVMGLFTVFVVLILISFVISRFKLIPVLEEKLAERKRKKEGFDTEVEIIPAVENTVGETEELVDDLELVAVITAAICASTGVSADGFVVRSIRKSKRNV